MSSHRAERVGEMLQQMLAEMIAREIKDPRVGFVTVTEVDVSPDLRQARVFVSCLGDDATREACLDGLRHAAPFLRRQIGRQARLKYAPELRFETDRSAAQGQRIETILRELHDDDGQA